MPVKKSYKDKDSGPAFHSAELTTSMRNRGCTVYYEKSVTKNLGEYNSAKITVGGTFPINPTEEELSLIKETFLSVDEIITEELAEQVEELLRESD